jgi:hypothetical protein
MATIVNAGKAVVTNRIHGAGTEPLNAGFGTSATAEAATQTDLVAAAANEARVAGAGSQFTTSVTNDTYRVQATVFCATAGKTINEVGLFDTIGTGLPVTGGNMYLRAVVGPYTLNVGDGVAFDIRVQY